MCIGWGPNAFVYLQIWNELDGTNQLIAFDESGELRTLYSTDSDRFFTGPGAALSSSIESRVEFQRDARGARRIADLAREATRRRERRAASRSSGGKMSASRTVTFGWPVRSSGRRLARSIRRSSSFTTPVRRIARAACRSPGSSSGTGSPCSGTTSGALASRPATGTRASFEDLAGDAVAAFEYLKTRQRYRRHPGRTARREPGGLDHADCRGSSAGSGVRDQRLGRRRSRCRRPPSITRVA